MYRTSEGIRFLKGSDRLYGDSPGQLVWFQAPVHLPHGATINQISMVVYDNSTTQSITVELFEMDDSALAIRTPLMAATSTLDSAAVQTFSVGGSVTVDNSAKAYMLQATWTVPSPVARVADIKLYKVRIRYTITKPLP